MKPHLIGLGLVLVVIAVIAMIIGTVPKQDILEVYPPTTTVAPCSTPLTFT